MSEGRMKQRMMSWSDLQSPQYRRVPDEAKPTAQALWLLMDVMGRGPLDEPWLAGEIFPELATHVAMDRLSEHLLMLMEAEFLTTFVAEGREWILLLRPLKADTRRARIETPEPPEGSPWTSVAVGRGRVGERARERARAQVRAEGAARADAWAALQGDAVREPLPPRRPLTLDAPPRFCSEHMPYGTRENCGPCRDARNVSSDWIDRKVYEERLAHHYAQQDDEEPF